MAALIQDVLKTVSSALEVQTIFFANHRKAQTVKITEELQDIALVFKTLNLSPSNGWISLITSQHIEFEEEINSRMAQLFSRGIAAVAAELAVTLIDNGNSNIINKLLGKGVADRRYQSPLIGVCEAALAHQKEHLEPNHSHFIFIESNQLNYIDVFNKIMDYLSSRSPVLTLVIGGDDVAGEQVLHSVRQGFPIIIINKTGGLADELSNLKQNPPEFISNPMYAEIIAEGKLYLFEIEGNLDKKIVELQRLIRRLLRGDTTLRQAWERFVTYDFNARRYQQNFRNMQLAILFLTVLGTGLALVQNSLERHLERLDHIEEVEKNFHFKKLNTQPQQTKTEKENLDLPSPLQLSNSKDSRGTTLKELTEKFLKRGKEIFQILNEMLRSLIIFIPIMITALLAAANRFNTGSQWLLLRGSAQSVLREIFMYRAHADYYSNEQGQLTREERLAERLKDINNSLLQSDISSSCLRPFQDLLPPSYCIAKNDDGISYLSPEQYLNYRLEDQYNYYVKKTTELEIKFKRLQWGIYIIGGIGTLLAAIGMEVWIAFTGVLVAALGTYLEYQQIEKTLMKYNRAGLELTNVKTWWIALPATEQEKQINIDNLVLRTEQILSAEFSDWMQEMQQALSSLKEKQRQLLNRPTDLTNQKDETKKAG